MKKYDRFYMAMLVISVFSTALAVIGRIFLTLTAIDRHGVYERGNILPNMYHGFLVAVIWALSVVAIIIGRKKSSESLIPTSGITVFFSYTTGFILCVDLVLSLYNVATSGARIAIVDILELAFAIPAIAFFLMLPRQNAQRSTRFALISLFPAAWCAVCVMKIYFNTTILMESPDKIIGEFALVLAMLYFLMEARNQIGIKLRGLYSAAASVAPILLLTASVPNLICSAELGGDDATSIIKRISYISISLFIYARLASQAKNPAQ